MIGSTSKEFRSLFLLKFTEGLLRNSVPKETFELKEVLPQNVVHQPIRKIILPTPKKTKKEIRHIIKEKEKKFTPISEKQIRPLRKIKPLRPIRRRRLLVKGKRLPRNSVLTSPATKIPAHLQYLKPLPTKENIDLAKLNSLIKDPVVRTIRCNGEDENLLVVGAMGTKKTNIILSKEEINEVIQKFSQVAKIPVSPGIFRVALGNLIFSAVVSDVISSKFIIEKMVWDDLTNPYSFGLTVDYPLKKFTCSNDEIQYKLNKRGLKLQKILWKINPGLLSGGIGYICKKK